MQSWKEVDVAGQPYVPDHWAISSTMFNNVLLKANFTKTTDAVAVYEELAMTHQFETHFKCTMRQRLHIAIVFHLFPLLLLHISLTHHSWNKDSKVRTLFFVPTRLKSSCYWSIEWSLNHWIATANQILIDSDYSDLMLQQCTANTNANLTATHIDERKCFRCIVLNAMDF